MATSNEAAHRTVGDVVKGQKVVARHKTDRLDDLFRAFVCSKVSSIPIVDDNGFILGIVTKSDMRAHCKIPLIEEDTLRSLTRSLSTLQQLRSHTAGSIMIRDVTSVSCDTLLTNACMIMLSTGYHGLPVVQANDNKRVVGMVTRTDILTSFMDLVDSTLAAEAEAEREKGREKKSKKKKHRKHHDDRDTEQSEEEAVPSSDGSEASGAAAEAVSKDIDGVVWVQLVDPVDTSQHYYWNKATGETSWEAPAGWA